MWRWIFFSHIFQLAFTFKTIFKALDHDLNFVQCYTSMGQHAPFLCIRVCVQPPLCLYKHEAKTESVYSYSISSCISCVLQMICSEAGVHLVPLQPWGDCCSVFLPKLCKFLFTVCACFQCLTSTFKWRMYTFS